MAEEVRWIVDVLKVIALCFASFSVGFSLCNVVWVFRLGEDKRQDRNHKTSRADKQSENRDGL